MRMRSEASCTAARHASSPPWRSRAASCAQRTDSLSRWAFVNQPPWPCSPMTPPNGALPLPLPFLPLPLSLPLSLPLPLAPLPGPASALQRFLLAPLHRLLLLSSPRFSLLHPPSS